MSTVYPNTAINAAINPVTATPTNTVTVKATVGKQEYSLRVAPEAVEDLNRAVALVNKRFNAIVQAGKVKDAERIAVMVSLNLAAEINKLKDAPAPGFHFPNTDVGSLRQHISQALRT